MLCASDSVEQLILAKCAAFRLASQKNSKTRKNANGLVVVF
jgi:hypothetical protein